MFTHLSVRPSGFSCWCCNTGTCCNCYIDVPISKHLLRLQLIISTRYNRYARCACNYSLISESHELLSNLPASVFVITRHLTLHAAKAILIEFPVSTCVLLCYITYVHTQHRVHHVLHIRLRVIKIKYFETALSGRSLVPTKINDSVLIQIMYSLIGDDLEHRQIHCLSRERWQNAVRINFKLFAKLTERCSEECLSPSSFSLARVWNSVGLKVQLKNCLTFAVPWHTSETRMWMESNNFQFFSGITRELIGTWTRERINLMERKLAVAL